MSMLRSIATAITLKHSSKNYSPSCLSSFYYASLNFGHLWYSSSTAYAVNDDSKKDTKHYSRLLSQVFAFICVELEALRTLHLRAQSTNVITITRTHQRTLQCLAYGNCAHSTSGSQNLAVLPKRHDNSLSLRN